MRDPDHPAKVIALGRTPSRRCKPPTLHVAKSEPAGDIADEIAYKTALPIDESQIAPEQATNSLLAVGMAAAARTD